MSAKARLARLARAIEAGTDTGPLTVFLCEADADHPTGRRTGWGGAALELTTDPAAGPPALPSGEHKLILNAPPGLADWV